MVVALIVAVLAAAGAGLWWWLSSAGKSSYSDEAVRDAKAKVCMQTKEVRRGWVINTNFPPQEDARAFQALTATARLAVLGGGVYLHNLVADQPAAPADLADAVTAVADSLELLGVNYLAAQPDEANAPIRKDIEDRFNKVDELCH